ncbi:MAG TPA: hypothetical protein QF621_06460 [Candidatus Thalassarchaeaceae archaeon]|jgi:hypothetical protein|nr:hypothetical protein [Candidatus Thalassarchaeaceae archaeon]HJM86804.1 hypothetical protein [Candidatus Thalassarchaeaceae archaeon]
MGGFWPFKKKAAEPEEQKIVTYSKDDNSADELLADRSHVEDEQYKAALDLLTTPHLDESEGGKPSEIEVVDTKETSENNYVQSGDGYWYLKKEDGSFDSTAYIKNDDGTFSPYAE